MLLWKEKERQRDIQTDTQQNKRTSPRREVKREVKKVICRYSSALVVMAGYIGRVLHIRSTPQSVEIFHGPSLDLAVSS